MKNSLKKYIVILSFISFLTIPLFKVQALELNYNGLVKCDGAVSISPTAEEAQRNKVCNFNYLVLTIKSTIDWLFVLTIPLVTALLAYGGLLYLTGSQGNITQAKKIFSSAIKGFIIMLIAWFAVVTVVKWFIDPEMLKVINTFVNI